MYKYGPSLSMKLLGFFQLFKNTVTNHTYDHWDLNKCKKIVVLQNHFANYQNNLFSCSVLSGAKAMQCHVSVCVKHVRVHIQSSLAHTSHSQNEWRVCAEKRLLLLLLFLKDESSDNKGSCGFKKNVCSRTLVVTLNTGSLNHSSVC